MNRCRCCDVGWHIQVRVVRCCGCDAGLHEESEDRGMLKRPWSVLLLQYRLHGVEGVGKVVDQSRYCGYGIGLGRKIVAMSPM